MTPPRNSFLKPKRKKPIAKSQKAIARSRIKPKKRKPSEFARIYGSKERVAWVTSQPCIACHRTACDGHHITVKGMGIKADYDQIIPLCRSHHSAIHAHGSKTFAALVGVDLEACAADTERRWLQHCGEEAA